MGVLDLICCGIGCWLEVHELCPEDDGEPLLFYTKQPIREMISLYSKVMGYDMVFPLPILHTFLDVENVSMNDYAVEIHAKLSAYRDYMDNFIL